MFVFVFVVYVVVKILIWGKISVVVLVYDFCGRVCCLLCLNFWIKKYELCFGVIDIIIKLLYLYVYLFGDFIMKLYELDGFL